MKLCHVEEHLSCYQYGTVNPALEIIKLPRDEKLQISSESNQVGFVIKGSITLTCKQAQNMKIKTEEMVLIPLYSPCIIKAQEDVIILMIKLNLNINFCNHLPLELLFEEYGKVKNGINIGLLPPNQRLTDFAEMLKECMDDGVKCSFFFDLKMREFLYLVRAYYDRKSIFDFFSPIYSNNFVFSNKVYQNKDKVKTIKELAKLFGYSVSGFEKRFKLVFKVSPYQWMLEQKAKKIYHEINCTKRTFSEMASEFGFSSPAHFNDFCKNYFGVTPGILRKQNRERSINLDSVKK